MEYLDLSRQKLTILPEYIRQYKNLKHLKLFMTQLEKLPEWIGEFSELEELNISFCPIKTLPDSIGNLKKLKKLSMNIVPLKTLPASIGGLSELVEWSMNFHSNSELIEVPDSIGQLIKLEEFSISGHQLKKLPAEIGQLKKLKKLNAASNHLQYLPPEIGQLENLQELNLTSNRLKQLPQGIRQLQNLKKLNLSKNIFCSLPDTIGHLSQLEDLDISQNQLIDLPKNMVELKNLQSLKAAFNKFEKLPECCFLADFGKMDFGRTFRFNEWLKKYGRFTKSLKAANLNSELKRCFYEMVVRRSLPIEQDLHLLELLELLKINFSATNQKILAAIRSKYQAKFQENPLKRSKSRLALLGSLSFNKADLKGRLKDLNIPVTYQIKHNTTHVVIGTKIKKYTNADAPHLIFITEQEIREFLDKNEEQLLLNQDEDSAESLSNLSLLLLSMDERNVKIGLSMIQSMGIPKNLMTALFLIYRNPTFDSNTKQAAKKLLKLNASEELKKVMEKPCIFMKKSGHSYYFGNSLNIFTRNTELDKVVIGQYLFDRDRKIHSFWFKSMTDAQRAETIPKLIGMNSVHPLNISYFSEASHIYPFSTGKNVQLYNCKLSAFPKELLDFKQLEILNLQNNQLKELPEGIINLTQLQHINLKNNRFEKFPYVLLDLPNLQSIDLSNSPFLSWAKGMRFSKFRKRQGVFTRK